MKKFRSRSHMLLLYPDNELHMSALDMIKTSYDYALILHNKDTNEDGELKKDHYHVVIRFNQPKWNTALAKELSIELNFIQEVRKFENALQYLIHYNDKDKAQYSIDNVHGTLKTKLTESINKIEKSEGEKVTELLTYITEKKGILTITEFAHFCATNGYWAEFRRSGSIFCKIIEEHNFLYSQSEHKH